MVGGKLKKLGQQEMVGFVLIVVLVIVGLMVFLVISVRDSPEAEGSIEVENILNAVMKHTTECAVVYEPDYDNFEDLFKSCYQGKQCSNLGVSACDYLNESLKSVLWDLMLSEAIVEAYQFDLFVSDGDGLLRIFEGNCSGRLLGAQRSIISGSDSLVIRMEVCGGSLS
jgi:hypothetical protein